MVHEDLWNQLVTAYALLETDRARFVLCSRSPGPNALPAKEAQGLKLFSYELGHLRRQLGGGGAWMDEIQHELKPRISNLNDHFKRWLDGLSEDDLKKDAVIAEVKHRAKELGELNQNLGDHGAWSEIDNDIKRRLK
jgi:hypothetical protein